jgi:hypothetical protein
VVDLDVQSTDGSGFQVYTMLSRTSTQYFESASAAQDVTCYNKDASKLTGSGSKITVEIICRNLFYSCPIRYYLTTRCIEGGSSGSSGSSPTERPTERPTKRPTERPTKRPTSGSGGYSPTKRPTPSRSYSPTGFSSGKESSSALSLSVSGGIAGIVAAATAAILAA